MKVHVALIALTVAIGAVACPEAEEAPASTATPAAPAAATPPADTPPAAAAPAAASPELTAEVDSLAKEVEADLADEDG